MGFFTIIYLNDLGLRHSCVVFARGSSDAVCRFRSNFSDDCLDYSIVEVLELNELIDCRIESYETTH